MNVYKALFGGGLLTLTRATVELDIEQNKIRDGEADRERIAGKSQERGSEAGMELAGMNVEDGHGGELLCIEAASFEGLEGALNRDLGERLAGINQRHGYHNATHLLCNRCTYWFGIESKKKSC